jgi:hypothetical protein
MSRVQTNFRAQDFVSSGSAPETEPEATEPEAPEESSEVPTGTINEVKAWVGDDKERAQAALDAENEKDNPRSTLVDWLEGVLAEEDDSE